MALAAVCVIGWIDHATGPELGLQLFYLVPISAVAWRTDRTGGGIVATAAAASWLAADLVSRPDGAWLSTLWNGFSRLIVFNGAAVLLVRLRADHATLSRLNEELQRLAEAEGRLARTDPLTGLRNRRAFLEDLRAEIARCDRSREPICVAYLDVDGFKALNDTMGHEAGDALLRRVAAALQATARAGDVPARLAGDEFALLLHAVTAADARSIAERLDTSLRRTCAEHAPSAGRALGVSIGVAHFGALSVAEEEVLRRADAAMYEAKRRKGAGPALWSDSREAS